MITVAEMAPLSASNIVSGVLEHMRAMIGRPVGPPILHEAKAILFTMVDQQIELRRMPKDGIRHLLDDLIFEIDPSIPGRILMRAPSGWADRLDSFLGNHYCRRCAGLVVSYAPHSDLSCDDAMVFGVLDA